MDIAGVNKLTLLNYPGHNAFMLFTRGCNFSCDYCHNKHILKQSNEHYSFDKILKYLIESKNKIDSIVISGGEPFLQEDLVSIIDILKANGFLIKIDTNGTNSSLLKYLIDTDRLDYVAMDVKGPISLYPSITKCTMDFSEILSSIEVLLNSNIDYEFRTTLISEYHDKESFINLLKLIKGAKNYYLQKYNPQDGVDLHVLPSEYYEEYLLLAKQYAQNVQLR